jgi:hypothetical protein
VDLGSLCNPLVIFLMSLSIMLVAMSGRADSRHEGVYLLGSSVACPLMARALLVI